MKMLTLFLGAVVPLMVSALCPADWSEYGQKCFQFVSDGKSWAQAETHCVNQGAGGHLASVHSAWEFTFLQGLTDRYAWIGGYEGGLEHIWFWSDGTKFDFETWADGEPDHDSGQHCLATNYRRRWDDGFCRRQYPFICQVPAQ